MLTTHADYALTAHTQRRHDVLWRQTVNTPLTMGADRDLRQMDGTAQIRVHWFCAQMATTIQVEAVGYFQMVDTLTLKNRSASFSAPVGGGYLTASGL